LLCVADNLEEDVDVCRELVFERLSTHDWEIVTLVTQGRQLLNGRRVWHPARVVFLLLTDAFRLGRLYRRCTNGGDGIRAFVYFVNAYRR
jgi:hypothetical protein